MSDLSELGDEWFTEKYDVSSVQELYGPAETDPENMAQFWAENDRAAALGTCQVCGLYGTGRYCYRTAHCREVGGADIL